MICTDEIPNHQVLERRPIRRSIPGSIEQQEFEYTRHGTVNILNFLIVHSGLMEATCIETKDAKHYVEELKSFRSRHRHLRVVTTERRIKKVSDLHSVRSLGSK